MLRKSVTLDQLLDAPRWNAERKALRAIMLDCGLEEAIKWGQLCYMAHGHNVALIFALKETVGVGFIKGALLADPAGELVSPGENSRSVMRMDFTSLSDIGAREDALRRFVAGAVEVEAKGLKVERDESQMPDWPEELLAAFEEDDALRRAFEALTPGRQRGYLIHFTGAKASEARARRVAKHAPRILAGKGMHDR